MIRPFLPEHRAAAPRSDLLDTIACNMVVTGLSHGGGDASALAEEMYPNRPEVKKSLANPEAYSIKANEPYVTKAAVTPLATTTSGAPVSTGLVHFLPLMKSKTLGRELVAAASGIELGPNLTMSAPKYAPSGAGVAYLGEGSPFPLRQISVGEISIGSIKKIALGTSATRELWEAPGAEAFLREFIAADLTLGFEDILLDTNAADSARPAGLANGVTPTVADAGSGEAAMINDLGTLAAICAGTGSANLMFGMSMTQYVRFLLRKPPNFEIPVFPSAALTEGEVCCFAPEAILFAGGGAPRWETSKSATLVMRDDPGAFSAVGSPNSISSPIRSLYQTDSVALKVLMPLDFVKRHADAYAYITNVNW